MNNTGSNVRQVVPFLWVKDMERSLKYYIEGLGFKKREEWLVERRVRWCSLQLGGAQIMLQEFWKEGPHQNLPNKKLGVGVAFNFMCEDALRIYHELTSKDIVIQKEPFVGNSMWVVSLNDPDGYEIYFESETDVPEETTYSDWIKEDSRRA